MHTILNVHCVALPKAKKKAKLLGTKHYQEE